jgi:hypothetical protein
MAAPPSPLRLLGTQALRYASTTSAAAASAALLPPADPASSITLPSGKCLELAAQDVSFAMPPEWAPHAGCWIAWPRRPDVWRQQGVPAKAAFADVIQAVARFEPVTVVAHNEQVCVCVVVRGVKWGAVGVCSCYQLAMCRDWVATAEVCAVLCCAVLCSGRRRATRCPTAYAWWR